MDKGLFSLEQEIERLESKYSSLKSKEDIDFRLFSGLLYALESRLIDGRQDPYGAEPLGDLPHTLFVTNVMMDLLYSEDMSPNQRKVGITTAIVHDVGYSILKGHGEDIRNFQSTHVRPAHMWAGASYVPLLLSRPEFKKNYSAAEILKVASIVSIHDNPSVPFIDKFGAERRGIPLDVEDTLLYMHREADRMDMISERGINVDVHRYKAKGVDQTHSAQVDEVIGKYNREKMLYFDDGDFFEDTLFRTPKAAEIYSGHVKARKNGTLVTEDV